MIIQYLLVAGLSATLLYAFMQRRKSRLVAVSIGIVSLAGMYLVLHPLAANEIARHLGVGRGADLLLYTWILVTLAICLNLQFKILQLQSELTILARRIAILGGREPD